VSVKINNGGTLTLVDSDILNKKDVLWPPKSYGLVENKTVYSTRKNNKMCTRRL